MQNESTKLNIARKSGEAEECSIIVSFQYQVEIAFQSESIKHISFTSADLFDALCELRKYLEQQGWYLLCNGCRLNAYPSRMSRQMSKGTKIYLYTLGKQARITDMVDIFGYADVSEVSTVSEQKQFYQDWLKSL